MKLNNNQKILIITLMAILFIMVFNVKVYAENEPFTLSAENKEVRLNGTTYLYYTGGDVSETVTWSSSDESVATVDGGKITALEIGTTTITATRGNETDSCEVTVVYSMLTIGGNSSDSVTAVNLVLNEHDTENLYATVQDDDYVDVQNAEVTWSSGDPSIVTVNENTGTITAVSAGTATITASAAGVSDTCNVTVVNGPVFTDFSNAKYELLYDTNVDLKISDVNPNEENDYYYIITSSNTKPTISTTSYGGFDTEIVTDAHYLSVNTEENYIYARNLDGYVELNQDLYLWIIEDVKLEAAYANDKENSYIIRSTKFVVEGEKLTRPELPQLNLILKSISIGHWSNDSTENSNYTYINFNFPTEQENRKFTLKIGKVTDINILTKIQNNDYSGITELLSYAKNNEAVYSKTLTTTSAAYFRSDDTLFDGNALLEDDAYYFIYAQFDDENGKYYPIEGVTLGQAWKSNSDSNWWDLWAYTSDNFDWNNLKPSNTPTEPKPEDPTVAPSVIPNAGNKTVIAMVAFVAIVSVILYKKYNKFSDIK